MASSSSTRSVCGDRARLGDRATSAATPSWRDLAVRSEVAHQAQHGALARRRRAVGRRAARRRRADGRCSNRCRGLPGARIDSTVPRVSPSRGVRDHERRMRTRSRPYRVGRAPSSLGHGCRPGPVPARGRRRGRPRARRSTMSAEREGENMNRSRSTARRALALTAAGATALALAIAPAAAATAAPAAKCDNRNNNTISKLLECVTAAGVMRAPRGVPGRSPTRTAATAPPTRPDTRRASTTSSRRSRPPAGTCRIDEFDYLVPRPDDRSSSRRRTPRYPRGVFVTGSAEGTVTGNVIPVDLALATPGGGTSGCEAADFAGLDFTGSNDIALIQRGTLRVRRQGAQRPELPAPRPSSS